MLKIWKNSYRPSIYVIACPVGFLTSGSGIEKGSKMANFPRTETGLT